MEILKLSATATGELREIAQRAMARFARRSVRFGHALRQAGPGRIPGAVLQADWEQDAITVSGWIMLRPEQVSAVLLSVDGTVMSSAILGLPTPNMPDGVKATRSPFAGWQGQISLSDAAYGPHTIEAVVVQRNGLTDHLGSQIAHRPPPPPFSAGHVDSPRAGSVIHAPVTRVTGWTRHDLGYDRIELSIDGGPAIRARILDHARPDIAAAVTEPLAAISGWEAWLPTPKVADLTPAVLRVEAVSRDQRLLLAERLVSIAAPAVRSAPEEDRLRLLSDRVTQLARKHRPAPGGSIRLLVATHQLGLGGGQLYLHELLRHLLARPDVTCHVFAHSGGVLRDQLEEWGAQVHIIGVPPVEGLSYEARILELVALAATTEANVVLANTGGAYWGVDLATRLNLPSVWAIHESFTADHFFTVGFPSAPDQWVASRYLAAFADASATIYEAEATKALFAELTSPGRAVRLDYGINLERIDAFQAGADRAAVRASLDIPAEAVAIVCMGTFEPRKAQSLLAVAFARAAERFPDARLYLVGDYPSPYSEMVHALVERLGMKDRIRLIPVTSALDDWYLSADCFVIASDIESLPMSVLEAMAFGIPVLASSVFGLTELLEDGQEGLLFRPGDIDELALAFTRALQLSAEDRRKLGDAGQSLVRATRDSRRYALSYYALLTRLLGDPSALPRSAWLELGADGAAYDGEA